MKEEILKNKRFNEVYTLYRTKLNLKDNDKVFEYFLCDLFIVGSNSVPLSFINITEIRLVSNGILLTLEIVTKANQDILLKEEILLTGQIEGRAIITTKSIKYLNKLESWINKHF